MCRHSHTHMRCGPPCRPQPRVTARAALLPASAAHSSHWLVPGILASAVPPSPQVSDALAQLAQVEPTRTLFGATVEQLFLQPAAAAAAAATSATAAAAVAVLGGIAVEERRSFVAAFRSYPNLPVHRRTGRSVPDTVAAATPCWIWSTTELAWRGASDGFSACKPHSCRLTCPCIYAGTPDATSLRNLLPRCCRPQNAPAQQAVTHQRMSRAQWMRHVVHSLAGCAPRPLPRAVRG